MISPDKKERRHVHQIKDLTGKRFGSRVVIGLAPINRMLAGGFAMWIAQCDCGDVRAVRKSALERFSTCHSCTAERRAKNKLKGTRIKRIWHGIISRCTNPNCKDFPRHGGRGIGMCERWRTSIRNFLADMGHPPEGHSIDRIDNAKGYSPDNCRWATTRQQIDNRRKYGTIDKFNSSELRAELFSQEMPWI